MRDFINVVQEAIVNRPYNTDLYLTNRIKDLGLLLEQLEQAKHIIATNESGEYIINYAIKSGSEGEASDVYIILYANVDYGYKITDLKYNLETYLKYKNQPGYDFLKYVMSTLDMVEPFNDSFFETIDLLKTVEQGFSNYGFVPGDPETENDPEYQAAKNLLVACKMVGLVVLKIQIIEKNLKEKLSVLHNMKNYYGDAHKYRPQHDEVETLYHATIYVNEIMKDGFSENKPEERKGVGNFGNQNLISFTHEPEVARTIMRAFKDIWMIAHGELTAPQIWGWIKSEGIFDIAVKSWKSQTNKPLPNRSSNPLQTVQLYRIWQWFTKLRSNPVMVNMDEIVESMKDRKLSDIGVLACEVRLSDVDEYHHAESEFRLPADRVLSIKKVL